MIGLCVGHSRKGDKGAYTSGDYVVSEWDFNRDLARRIGSLLDIAYKIYDDYELTTYSAAIRNISRKMHGDGVKAAIELHFNAATPAARGHEWLYWHSSSGGKRLATALRDEMDESFPEMASRGIKPRGPRQRGSAFLRKTHCPAVYARAMTKFANG